MTATDSQLRRWRRLLMLRDCAPINAAPDAPRLGLCALCGDGVFFRLSQLQAHHIRPRALFPKLALSLDNGVMLCSGCHQGRVHQGNAALDIRTHNPRAGWRLYVVHFNRHNELADVARFNEAHQPSLTA